MNPNRILFQVILCGLACLGCTLLGAESAKVASLHPADKPSQDTGEIKKRALELMRDITPVNLPVEPWAEVSSGSDRGVFGLIFGDHQTAAVVALKRLPTKDLPQPTGADLCLLLWNKSWNFAQYAGIVSDDTDYGTEKDWEIKIDHSSKLCYLISGKRFYPAAEHLSWLCDPKTHRLNPTGWRKDAVPSISGNTITFTYQGKPGFSPFIKEIHHFNGSLGNRIVTIADGNANGPIYSFSVTLWSKDPKKTMTWFVWKKSKDHDYLHNVYVLSQSAELREDVLVDFDWEGSDEYSAMEYLLWHMTGLNRNALWGIWNQGKNSEIVPPKTAKVTGPAEMIGLLQWPQNLPASTKEPLFRQ